MGMKMKIFLKDILTDILDIVKHRIEDEIIMNNIKILLNQKYSDEEIVNIICDQYKLNYNDVYYLIADVRIKEHSLTNDSSIMK